MKLKVVIGIVLVLTINLVLRSCGKTTSSISATQLRVEYKENPVIDSPIPRFSWILEDDERGQYQSACQILVASSPSLMEEGKADFWDSGKIKSGQTSQVNYQGDPLAAKTGYVWKVRAWDKGNQPGDWSIPARFEMGPLSSSDWQAKWVGYDLTHLGKGEVYHLPPAPYLRKEIDIREKVSSARLYVTALGLYDFFINGEKVGEDYFNPGWTNYDKRVYYHVYDVTEDLNEGNNSLASILSYGWYAGYVSYALLLGRDTVKAFYGSVPKLMAQLEVVYTSGEKEIFVSDGSWKASAGPLLETDLLEGETYDARKEIPGWDQPGFEDAQWDQVKEYAAPGMKVEIHPVLPIRIVDSITPLNITRRPEGYIFDMGQNFAGIIELKVKGKAGEEVVLKYGEMLHPDGRLMTENLRLARATDTYILKGDPNGETWRPRFTYHGFQFVQLSGYEREPDEETILGLALSSDLPETGTFETGHPMINQLYSNIVWTQISNFLDIPTDCPQRDERMGWAGDAQTYVKSASLNRDVAAFFAKWIVDLNDEQLASGAYPNFAPKPFIREWRKFKSGWGDAGIICPYHMYMSYGDIRNAEKFWPNMERFLDFYEQNSDGLYFFKEASFYQSGSGDWLAVGKRTPPDMLSTFYYGYCAQLMAEMATAIGKSDRADHYLEIFEKIKTGFKSHYMGEDGMLKCNEAAYGDGTGYPDGHLGFSGHTQTAYANAIYMNFLTPEEEIKAGEHLVDLIRENGGKLTTGFLGVKPLLLALSKTGHSEIAYDLFLQTEYPSWGFEVVNGATTMWERWNSYTHEDGFGGTRNTGMNSFSHYAFGAVCEWMFGNAAGITAVTPAFREISIRPEPDKRLGFVNCSYQSISGEIISNWKYDGDDFYMEVKVPVNVSASIYVPATSLEQITENGVPAGKSSGLEYRGMEGGYVLFKAGSGSYSFKSGT
jgi:alpha-L-rhamnosidase